jgi:SAM-dependent methyltransferase
VLICNTYHEFNNPELMLNHVFRSLRPGGRLVVVDRAPRAIEAEHVHGIPLTVVEKEIRQKEFKIVSQDDHFIDQPRDDLWWLLIARKP